MVQERAQRKRKILPSLLGGTHFRNKWSPDNRGVGPSSADFGHVLGIPDTKTDGRLAARRDSAQSGERNRDSVEVTTSGARSPSIADKI